MNGMRSKMILISGTRLEPSTMWTNDRTERTILESMVNDPTVYSYQTVDELAFDLNLRKNIIASAKAMNQGHAQFAVFANSFCNPRYWQLSQVGGFRLRHDVYQADAIRDIFINSSLYGFECATAMIIIYYHAVLNVI